TGRAGARAGGAGRAGAGRAGAGRGALPALGSALASAVDPAGFPEGIAGGGGWRAGDVNGASKSPAGAATPNMVDFNPAPASRERAELSSPVRPNAAPNTGAAGASGSPGESTLNEVPHLGHLIFRPVLGTRRSST